MSAGGSVSRAGRRQSARVAWLGAGGRRAAECPCPAAVLAEVIKAFGAPENAQRMEEARDNACNDMGKMLQFLLPVATQIQQDVIKAYGFSSDGEGGLFPRRAGCSGPAGAAGRPAHPLSLQGS